MFAESVVLLALVATSPRPEPAVREFYKHVIETHPMGIPEGEVRKLLWPYLTSRLARVLDDAAACEHDYDRRFLRPDEKAAYWWSEAGIFSGNYEEGMPAEMKVVAVRAS